VVAPPAASQSDVIETGFTPENGQRHPHNECVLAVRRRAWGPLVVYPPLMSYIFFKEALNEIGDSI
jgi:hypothetical protein